MAELKPCPFCGGEAQYNEKKVEIRCTRCNAAIQGVKAFGRNVNYKFWLAQLWDRRVDE